MDMMSNLRAAAFASAVLLFVATSPAAAANDCDRLPESALKGRACNPQAECMRAIPRELKGAARAQREKECSHLPTAGVCHGPDRYDPQADCRGTRRR
jgi:hypothetical protein